MRRRASFGRVVCMFVSLGATTSLSHAAVTEPNGQEVPILRPTEPTSYSETTIQDYFNGVGESGIDAVHAAAADPGKFSPLCNFDATLVFAQSGAAAGISRDRQRLQWGSRRRKPVPTRSSLPTRFLHLPLWWTRIQVPERHGLWRGWLLYRRKMSAAWK